MKVRLQADADFNLIILLATIRQEPAIDFRSATAAGLCGMGDPEVLARAANDGRVLVTHDRRTMPRHFAQFVARQTSSGLILVPQSLSAPLVVSDLILIWSTTEAEEWVNRIGVLPL